ncbi:hypothetical protein ACJIZ3_020372 [Penstemon smallii]|uniref:Uncharacterized protein n=1 Tax=Penstemon smallii TaxID=265156 RepID=A0ABD3SJ21_9LAMI
MYCFDYPTVTASTVTGWLVCYCFHFSQLYSGFSLYLVGRAKKCLHFSHCIYMDYGGWPSSITWWVVNISSLATMSLLGEYLCMRRELQGNSYLKISIST